MTEPSDIGLFSLPCGVQMVLPRSTLGAIISVAKDMYLIIVTDRDIEL
jgi:hypothetical protein